MSDVASFSSWMRRRRRALDLTQDDLARQVGCAAVMIRKIEADERRPSQQLAERLALCLKIAESQHAEFVRLARMVPTPHELAQLPIDLPDGLASSERYPDTLSLPADLQPALARTPHTEPATTPGYFTFLDKGHADSYRHTPIAQLARAIRARENRLVLGLPGMGVSNLLRFLVARGTAIVPQALFAYYDCDTLPGEDFEEALFEALAAQLIEQGLREPPSDARPGYARLQRLLMRVDGDPAGRIALVIDQADGLAAMVGRPFYQRLKALTDLNKRVCVFMALGPQAAAQADPDDLLFAGRRLAVGRLGASDIQDAIAEEARRLAIEFAAPTQALLAALAGGHPGLLRSLASATAAGALAGTPNPDTAAERMLARDDVRYRCRKLWNALPPTQQAALGCFVRGAPLDEAQLGWLCEYGLIERVLGADRVCSPIVREFVLTQAPPPEPAPLTPGALAAVTIVQPSLDRAGLIRAGKVLKGGDEVAVSRLALRLIYFLTRERRICTRHEIAGYVWFGANTEGVSDAAIDDLIRQVRQRLGGEYIKNHRGQGYEWMGHPDTHTAARTR